MHNLPNWLQVALAAISVVAAAISAGIFLFQLVDLIFKRSDGQSD
jgi:hypothetical protein